MRVIVLAAGQGFGLDGLCKCLIHDPGDGRTILDKVIEAFAGIQLTVVVGYRCVEIMQRYPELEYVYNADWASTNNSHSLGLALSGEPSYVLSSDLLFEPPLVAAMNAGPADMVLTKLRENRVLTSINCRLEGARVREAYVGALRDSSDPEAIGVFKISSPELLNRWKRNCLEHGNLFVGQNLPLSVEDPPIAAFDCGEHPFFEINTPIDYMCLMSTRRGQSP